MEVERIMESVFFPHEVARDIMFRIVEYLIISKAKYNHQPQYNST